MDNAELARTFASLIEHVLAAGLSLPLYMVSVSSNGPVLAFRFEMDNHGGLTCTPLWEHIPEGELIFPINFWFSDSAGKAMRAVLQVEGKEPEWIN